MAFCTLDGGKHIFAIHCTLPTDRVPPLLFPPATHFWVLAHSLKTSWVKKCSMMHAQGLLFLLLHVQNISLLIETKWGQRIPLSDTVCVHMLDSCLNVWNNSNLFPSFCFFRSTFTLLKSSAQPSSKKPSSHTYRWALVFVSVPHPYYV